ncbi:XRE family transcriptional regulator [Yersinia enterocolitica]|uniref:XRE family transcriptional regulator n=1 Tax=Yersinia enterocolitica TaxID=630 RepID=UPI00398D4453
MSSTQGEKLKLIRESERLNRRELTDLVGIPYGSYANYELDKMKMSFEAGVKIFKHPRFRKYQSWFMFDEVNPAAGQIAPALSLSGPEITELSQSEKNAG